LQVTWRGDVGEENFSLKLRQEEQLRQWQKAITKAVEDTLANRRSRNQYHISSSSSNSSRSRIGSPLSQFPNTPLSELGPSSASSSYSALSESAPYQSYMYSHASMPANGGYHTMFDDNEDASEGYGSAYETGRSTPNGMGRRVQGTQSLPPHARERDKNGVARPRAHTEDSNSNVIHQWRSQTPVGYPAMPSLPRGASMASTASEGSAAPSLRSSASGRPLLHKQSQEWGTLGTAASLNKPQPAAPPEEEYASRPPHLSRQNSQASLAQQHQTYASAAPPMRSRSASSPHVYQVNSANNNAQWSPYGEVPRVPPLTIPSKPSANTSSSSLAYQSSSSAANKRSSASSVGTDRSSGDSSGQGQNYSSATSPASTVPGSARFPSQNGNGRQRQGGNAGSAVKVKVNYGEDTLTIVVLNTITFDELVAKVLKKIRLCGDRARVDEQSIRLRYQDEEGDKILISADDDVAMAIEWSRTYGCENGGSSSLVLFVD
jgi:cell division control protein 24